MILVPIPVVHLKLSRFLKNPIVYFRWTLSTQFSSLITQADFNFMSKLLPVIGQLVRSCALIGQLRHHVKNFPKVTLLVSAVRSLMTLNFKS